MFEQSEQSYQYQYEPAPEPLKEGDPFYHYEIKNWDLGPRIYKIIGISALVNVLALVVAVQGSLLTMKGCDSPLVGSMCEVLDTVYVGSMLFGTEREWVDVAYDKTDLDDVDITYVDVTNLKENEKLYYPSDYWTIANPEKYTIDPETGEMIAALPPSVTSDIPGIPNGIPFTPPSTSGNSLFDTTPNYPSTNPNPVTGNLPQPGGSGVASNPIGKNRKGRGGRIKTTPTEADPNATPSPDPNTVAEVKPSPSPTVEPTGPVAEVELNKRPMVDLGNMINELLDKKQVSLETPFIISAGGKLDKDGKLDPKTFKWARAESPDPKMLEVVKEAIEAMNASGYLKYLQMFEAKDLTFFIQQDDNNVTAFVETQFKDDQRPRTMTTLFTNYVNFKKKEKEAPEASANDKDDLVLLQNAAATPNGKKMVISFTIPKADLHRMVQRKLAEQKAEPKQPNGGSATANPTDDTAKK